ncbi:DUF4864 domain-containing protein [Primorskyibacter aestuariivivens]|uniref:DUF4864 domain-containing protein n=1 Tax=Primorskyibacter aestuariivivens TaxID=1888912 RepID=UPI002300CE46|nr:DUF4864 domain-containing protein [Primorskyibacter aestuariivivens]MDA7428108.1 DUF4864 domain-containing protein [Primorskyibacter aestuariivivens]
MRHFLSGLVITLAFAATAMAQEVQPENKDIQSVIQGQLDAFLADDVSTAFTFAAPNIKGIFGTADNFGRMVENGYPMVWRPGDVRFLELRRFPGGLFQRVEIIDQSGQAHWLDYRMSQTENGWQISGVQILPKPDVSV